jgi:hypothetical protein
MEKIQNKQSENKMTKVITKTYELKPRADLRGANLAGAYNED